MSSHWLQEGLALLTVATAAAWLLRNWLVRRRAKTKGCAGCALAKAHGAPGAPGAAVPGRARPSDPV